MLVLSFLVVLLAGGGLLMGEAVLVRLDPWHYFDRPGDRAIIAIWIGVLVLANFFLIISLFGPLSPQVTIPATALLLGGSFWLQRKKGDLGALVRQLSIGTVIGCLALTMAAAAYCSQVVVWYDSGLYHVQVIKWLSEFGLVPGLALIHSRFGVISSWFALTAPFNHGVLQGRIASLSGALCLLLLLVHPLLAFARIVDRRGRIQDLFIVVASLLAVPVILVWGMPNSPSPDFPVIVLTMLVAWSLLTIALRQEDLRQTAYPGQVAMIPLILAVGAVSIKLSALPLVAVAACFCLFGGGPSIKKAAAVCGAIVLPLLPIAAAGVVTSGCAFYPASFMCTDLPWSLGAATAQAESRVIRNWARWGGLAPAHATQWNWILPWLQNEKVCTALMLLSLLAVLSMVASRAAGSGLRQMAYVVVLGGGGIAFMLYFAPSWRFGLGYLVVLPALAAAVQIQSHPAVLEKLEGIKGTRNFGLMGTVTAAVLALHVHVIQRPSYKLLNKALADQLVTEKGHPHFNLWLPPRLWNLNYALNEATGKVEASRIVVTRHRSGDVVYYRPEKSDTCWDTALPCSPYELQNIKLRKPAKGLRGGFEKIIPARETTKELPPNSPGDGESRQD